ncbi:SacI homology domain-containing protein [Elsinoe ampelina]|uniref:SacI homology domain-containing protein n=1 Tax=Elsinoe ampelina TaxID=302913 RepID=A0A6A6FYK9_9PEZI|nr:SacI homology domain-containing protein [Elsinoe ampelina]
MLEKPKEKIKFFFADKVDPRHARALGDTHKMPGLVRKLLICATAKGLLLVPLNSSRQPSTSPPTLIEYNTHNISPSLTSSTRNEDGLESHGLLGLLSLASQSYLVSITKREQVAQIRGRPIYIVTDVTFIPLSSQSDAQGSIDATRRTKANRKSKTSADGNESETDTETDEGSTVGTEDEHASLPETPAGEVSSAKGLGPAAKGTSVAEDVIKDKGRYGRFAERWFSRAGWTATGREKQGMSREDDTSAEEDLTREQKRQGLSDLPDGNTDEVPAELREGDTAVKQKKEEEIQPTAADKAVEQVEESVSGGIVKTLTPRILRTMKIFLSSRNFYFAYDHDLSRRLATQEPNNSTLPLFKRFDPLYFWNQHLIEPLIEAGQYAFVLPVIQGFVGQRAFTVGKTPKGEDDKIVDAVEDPGEVIELWERAIPRPESSNSQSPVTETPKNDDKDDSKDFLITLISRRSTQRAGLRYLRRGVDDQGNVANNVETEQLLSSPTWHDQNKIFSLVQVRGSIPLFFSQSPYSFKPIPITYGSEATNHLAFNKHFRNMLSTYGRVQIASLVDKHGTEKAIGSLYQDHVEMTNEGKLPSHGFPGPSDSTSKPFTSSSHKDTKPLAFTWFDFHHECRAFNFQNVSYLLDVLAPSLNAYAWTESLSSRLLKTQAGVVRTNCMDCLDRTNVVQSAIGGQVLTNQLSSEYGLCIDLTSDPKTQWFNTLWADNGDGISKQYAGTAALKGDYTRTRKRTWTGAINDFSHTLGRYYNNIFGDYFLQTTIDFMLGNGNESMWEEFESDLMTGDYALDMNRVRESAVERCVKVVLGRSASPSGSASSVQESQEHPESSGHDDEDLVSGYTLHTPGASNTLKTQPFEECVLLLTNRALYAVRFDWNTEKVGSYERVELVDVTGLRRGAYVTSTLGAKNLDEDRNVGFVVTYREGRRGIKRVNTRSLSTEVSKATLREKDAENERGKAAGSSAGEQPKADTEERDFAAQQPKEEEEIKKQSSPQDSQGEAETRLLAFKALTPRQTAVASDASSRSSKGKQKTGAVQDMSERDMVALITDEIHRLVRTAIEREEGERIGVKKRATLKLSSSVGSLKEGIDKAVDGAKEAVGTPAGNDAVKDSSTKEPGVDKQEEDQGTKKMWDVQDEPIISLAEARRSTGYLESIGYSLRRLVWA